MEQIDNAPQRNWAEMGWITHRTPTLTDTDSCEDVLVPRRICEPVVKDNVSVNYRTIVPGQPWYSYSKNAQADPPATAKPDQFAALDRRVVVVENTMRQLLHGSKFRLVVEPR